MRFGRGLAYWIAAAGLVVVLPAAAQAAEVVVTEPTGVPQQVVVERGKSARFELAVSATGNVSCVTTRRRGVHANVDTRYDVGQADITSSAPSDPLPFYAGGRGILSCPVAWDGAPNPYRLIATVNAAVGAPLGHQQLALRAGTTNPGLSFLGPLRDDAPSRVDVEVINPLPPARENNSVNVMPISGATYVRQPGDVPRLITQPLHITVNSNIDSRFGHVDLTSDGDGAEKQQSGEFWDGRFKVGYSRQATPAQSNRAALPYTELRLLGGVPRTCNASGATNKPAQTSRARRRRRLWGRGRGRFRTRGRRGAATVRGTAWLTQDSCRGTLVRVSTGVVSVRDFSLGRTFRVPAGSSYLAAPPGVTDGHG
jgi:hypothetical protein